MNVLIKTTNIFLICLISLALFEGCKSKKYNFFIPEDLTWLVYSQGDSIKFSNSSGQTRTYIVSDVKRGYIEEDGVNNEHVGATILLKNDTNDVYTKGFVYLVKKSEGLLVSAGWAYYPATLYPQEITPVNDTVAGMVYNDVYISRSASTSGDIKEVRFSKTKGFIRFIQNNGKVWSITN